MIARCYAHRLMVGFFLTLTPALARADTVRIYVTNSAGDSIHVIDPSTNKVVQEIKGIEAAHGIGFTPDGSKVYVSDEANSTLDVFDRKSGTKAGYIYARPPPPDCRNLLATHGRTIHWVKSRGTQVEQMTSALTRIADQ